MSLDNQNLLPYVVSAYVYQGVLIIHFALRKWRFEVVLRHGWNVYAMGIPAAAVSIILLLRGVTWSMWLPGFLWLIWGAYGYWIEYIRGIQWRNPPLWRVLGPYLLLYLAISMFFWWPLWSIDKRLWYVQTGLYIISTGLNLASHRPRTSDQERAT